MNPMNALRDMRTIKVLLTEAERIARDLGDDEPGAEHLLLSAIGLPDGAAARALGRFDIDAARLRSAIEREHADALAAIGIDAVTVGRQGGRAPAPPVEPRSRLYRSSPSAQEVFQTAGAMARSARQRLSSAHVVLAAADVELGTLARVLDALGVERAALRDAARGELG
jgi:ATP-dependent Clp protease ATP-binding subunit ClpA